MASNRLAVLLIEHTELFMDMQSYAVLLRKISVMRFFKLCLVDEEMYCLFGCKCLFYIHEKRINALFEIYKIQ